MPKSMPKFVVFSSIDFVRFWRVWGAFLLHFLTFLGLATTEHEKPGYVKFVDSIEKLVDFQKTQGHKFQNNFKFRVLDYVDFLSSFRAAFLLFLGSF